MTNTQKQIAAALAEFGFHFEQTGGNCTAYVLRNGEDETYITLDGYAFAPERFEDLVGVGETIEGETVDIENVTLSEVISALRKNRDSGDAYATFFLAFANYGQRSPVRRPRLGDRVTLCEDVERYPHFTAPKGAIGTVVISEPASASPALIAVKLDEHLDGAEEWNNEVHWTEDEVARFPLQTILGAPNAERLADEALNAACKSIQDALGVAGDFASRFFCDGSEDRAAIERVLLKYAQGEVSGCRAEVA